ncbi:unnamed protein product [Didymodactylos carnosus]|uniref:L-Fucosyltransferase n=1 Tax=Didymodactylos carnosus TaxID=1234261 RepID=A0A815SBY4_9BILA|nr:unnamed protein product [Didymodactylos carnosus]CAF1492921.1 unnamed protein product [Didymodactylos carnosus]CAF4282086.1 unnamed protein product [Didymodactylos carnosus]CAF4353698.1 unnamed protein product [Didymodactylos carnosus]
MSITGQNSSSKKTESDKQQNISCLVVLRERSGRLGNRMFMFASAMGLALTHSCRLYIDQPIINELLSWFQLNLPKNITINKEHYTNLSRFIQQKKNLCTYFPELMKPYAIKYLELRGFWQAHGHFVKFKNEIRKQFTFKPTIAKRIASFFKTYICQQINCTSNYLAKNVTQVQLKLDLRDSPYTWIGIHIRRGDYLRGRRVSSIKFIIDAMDYFIDKYGNKSLFVITSDDKSYCARTFLNRTNVLITPSSFSPADDLATLAVCEHTIVTVGTFGWWGAFLSGGEAICDVKSSQNPTAIDNNCARQAFFPEWFSYLNKTS